MLPRIEPMSEALTTSCSPRPSANRAMISSGALPKVTLSSPPMPGPERAASSSVARPMSAAVGMTPSAEVKKIAVAEAPATSSAIAIGMNGTSRYGQPSLVSSLRGDMEGADVDNPDGEYGAAEPRRVCTPMPDPSHIALGAWSGGRFMHFGEPLDDDRLAALLRPDAALRTVMTADVYGAGEADRVVGRAV